MSMQNNNMNDPSVWDRFMPALQQAGGTLGQAGGQAFEAVSYTHLPLPTTPYV